MNVAKNNNRAIKIKSIIPQMQKNHKIRVEKINKMKKCFYKQHSE